MKRLTDTHSYTAFLSARTCKAFIVLPVVSALLCSCASFGPQPWEKDLMARREMQVNGYPLQAAADDHIYFSKEAASGGRGFAGGGCGCN
jgi:uncharacterized protein DUF4266